MTSFPSGMPIGPDTAIGLRLGAAAHIHMLASGTLADLYT